MKNEDGLNVRTREDGVQVLDGAQKCTAFVHVHQMEREEEVVEFADGTPLTEVEDTMTTLAETLLSNCSEVGFGWYVPRQ